MSTKSSAAAVPPADSARCGSRDAALIACEHERVEAARVGKPIGLVFEAIERAAD